MNPAASPALDTSSKLTSVPTAAALSQLTLKMGRPPYPNSPSVTLNPGPPFSLFPFPVSHPSLFGVKTIPADDGHLLDV
jgi:hypothetical protein